MGTAQKLKIGIDVGGTFTDFIVAGHGDEALIHKVLSTPQDPSIAVLTGLAELAACQLQAGQITYSQRGQVHVALAPGQTPCVL